MYKLTKDNGTIMAYQDLDPFYLIGEYNESSQSFDWEEDVMMWGNVIGEFETEEELIDAYRKVVI